MAKIKNIDEERDNKAEISKNLLGSLLNGYREDHYTFIQDQPYNISSGSLILDSFISVKTGSVLRIGGASAEVGKTSQCFLFADSFMKTVPKSKSIYVKTEARLSEEMKKRTGLNFVCTAENWSYSTVFVLDCNRLEVICQMIEPLLKSMYEQGEHLCIIIDSIDSLTLRASIAKEFGERTAIASIPFLTKELFRRLALPINKYNALLLFTSQYSSTIKLDPYSKEPPKLMEGSSANALNHQSEYALYYRHRYQSDYILENQDEKPDPVKNKIIGVYATVEIKKSASDVSGTILKIPIKRNRVGNAVWTQKEVGDMLLQWSLASKAGAGWISFAPEILKEAKEFGLEIKEKLQGLNNLYSYLDENKKICDWFYNKIKTVIS